MKIIFKYTKVSQLTKYFFNSEKNGNYDVSIKFKNKLCNDQITQFKI